MANIQQHIDILNTSFLYINTFQSNYLQIDTTFLKSPLYPHQKTIVSMMQEHYTRMTHGYVWNGETIHSKLGIIGDPHGSGKTLEILSYIGNIPRTITNTSELSNNSTRYFFSSSPSSQLPSETCYCNLIIVPSTLFNQWKNETVAHTHLKFIMVDSQRCLKNVTARTVMDSHFILVSSSCFRYLNNYAIEQNIQWNNVFIDEADTAKIPFKDLFFNFQFIWFIITPWYNFILNTSDIMVQHIRTLAERACVCDDMKRWLNTFEVDVISSYNSRYTSCKMFLPLNHKLVGLLVIRNKIEDLENSIVLPSVNRYSIKCTTEMSTEDICCTILRKGVPFISENIPLILNILHINPTTNSILLENTPAQRHELILKKYIEEDCEICFDKAKYKLMVMCCNHVFCCECLFHQFTSGGTCPTCRERLSVSKLRYIGAESVDGIDLKTKTNICINIIDSNHGSKIIIYVLFDNIIEQICHHYRNSQNIVFLRADSRPNIMTKCVKEFTTDSVGPSFNMKTKIMFITTAEYIRGLSLQRATHLILMNEIPFHNILTGFVHSAQRIGRNEQLHIIHLISELD